MPSIPLRVPADLAQYNAPDNEAQLTVFDTHASANEYLLVVFGTNSFGDIGELAHLCLSEELFNTLATYYPMTTTGGLTRSENLQVAEVQQLLTAHWPPASVGMAVED